MKRFTKTGGILVGCLLGFFLILHLTGAKAEKKQSGALFTVGKTETRSSSSSSSVFSSSDHSTFNSRRVILVQGNSNSLGRRIGSLVVERLKDFSEIETLDLVDAGAMPAEGMRAPDLFMRLDLVALKDEGLLSHMTKTTVTGSLGSAPWQSSHFSEDATTLQVQFAWNTTIDSESTFSGIRSDRYADVARSIADEFAKGVSNEIQTLSRKFPPSPALAEDFYGPYQPVNDFAFLKELKAVRSCSYYGLLTHNQTFWKFQTTTNPVPQLERIISQLEAAQWKLGSATLTNTEDYFLSARLEDAELEIFRLRGDRLNLSVLEIPTALEFVVHYRKPFSRAEREAAVEKLFVNQPSLEILLPFQNTFSPVQREKFYALMEKSPATSPLACVQVAESYLNRKQTNAALNMVLRAKALAVIADDPSDLESRISSLAKKISREKELKLNVTPEICRELNFLEITNHLQTVERECALGQPLLMFGMSEGKLNWFALTIRPPHRGVYPWAMVQARDGVRSSSWSSFDLTHQKEWRQIFTFGQQTLKATGIPLPDQQRVKYTVEVQGQ